MKNVIDLGKEKIYQDNGDMVAELNEVVDKFAGKVSLLEAIGALELVKADLIDAAQSEC